MEIPFSVSAETLSDIFATCEKCNRSIGTGDRGVMIPTGEFDKAGENVLLPVYTIQCRSCYYKTEDK